MAAGHDGSVVILIEGDDSDLKSKLNGIGGIASGAATAAATAIAGISAALAGAAAHAVKVGAEFEASMSNVAAISGATGTELERLTEKAKEMGAKTKFSASQSAEAFTYMAMAGWETEDMLSGIEGIMDLAAASGEGLAATSDIVTDALTAFGLTAGDSAHFADVLATASNSANTNVAMLGESFKYVAPVAGALGYSAEDTAVALGLMANSGIKASQAGTALRTALTNMAKPTDDMAWAMNALGVSLTDGEGDMHSLMEVMDQLRAGFQGGAITQEEYNKKYAELMGLYESGAIKEKDLAKQLHALEIQLNGTTEAQRAELAAMLAGKEGMSGLLAIVNAGEEDYQKLADAIYSADGAAKEMAEIQLDNLAGQLDILKSAVEGFEIEFFQSVGNPITETVTAAADAVSHLTETFKSEGLGAAIEELGGMAASALTALAASAPAFIETAAGLIQSFLDGIRENLLQIAAAAVDIVGGLASGIVEILPELAGTGMEIISSLASGIADALPELIPSAMGAVLQIAETLTDPDSLGSIVDSAAEIVSSLASGIADALPELIPAAVEAVLQIAEALTDPDSLGSMIDSALELIAALAEGLVDSLPKLAERVPKIIENIVETISDNLPKIVTTAGKIILTLAKGLIAAIPDLVSVVPDLVKSIVNAFSNLGSNFADIGKNIVSGIANGIRSGAAAAINAITDLASSVVDKAKSFLGIKSPSRVMAKEVGPYLPQGVAVGVEKEIPRTERTVARQMAGLTNRVRAAVEAETANISVGLTTAANGADRPEPAPNGGTVVNVYMDSGTPENTQKARNLGRELGAEAARELRRRGAVPT